MNCIFKYDDHYFITCNFFASKYFNWTSVHFMSILGEFSSQFIQTIYLPLPWQRVYVEIKEILISWFCINNKQIRKVLTNSVTMLSTMFKVAAEKNTELQKNAYPAYRAHT